MARIELKEGVKLPSGTVGNLTFQKRNGRMFVHQREEPILRKGASRKEKAQYKRRVMVNACIQILQMQMPLSEALRVRKRMYDRLRVLCDKYMPVIKARTKLQRRIMEEYYSRYSLDNGPMESR